MARHVHRTAHMRRVWAALSLVLSGCCVSHAPDLEDAGSDSPPDAPDVPAADRPDAGNACASQDARATGACRTVLDGVVWDGAHCVPLGQGCACEGIDCGMLYATVADCVDARRPCYAAGCAPQAVADTQCVFCAVVADLGWFWSGQDCFNLAGCLCAGDGCAGGFASLDECLAVESVCDASLCRATGGEWHSELGCSWTFRCGVPTDGLCADSTILLSSCNCGVGRTFVAGAGCATDPTCAPESFCRGSGGQWHAASECIDHFSCGQPFRVQDCPAWGLGTDTCDCGPHRNFDPARGCYGDSSCAATAQQICAATGGSWQPSCCGFICGVEPLCARDCSFPPPDQCNCGPLRIFDPALGCIDHEPCAYRDVGASCFGSPSTGGSSCREGAVCCPPCCGFGPCPNLGGTCSAPCCPSDPTCGPDGCPLPLCA